MAVAACAHMDVEVLALHVGSLVEGAAGGPDRLGGLCETAVTAPPLGPETAGWVPAGRAGPVAGVRGYRRRGRGRPAGGAGRTEPVPIAEDQLLGRRLGDRAVGQPAAAWRHASPRRSRARRRNPPC